MTDSSSSRDERKRLVERLDAFLSAQAIAPSRFGRLVMADPRFVFDVRRGRCPTVATRCRVQAAMARLAGQGEGAR